MKKVIAKYQVSENEVCDYIYSLFCDISSYKNLIRFLYERQSSLQNNEKLEEFQQKYMELNREYTLALQELSAMYATEEQRKRSKIIEFDYNNSLVTLYE